MSVADRLVDVLLVACEVLDFLYFPGRHLRVGESSRFRREEVRRALAYLREEGLLQRHRDASGWVYRLTAKGEQRIGVVSSPKKLWARPWDGLWRQIIYDIPARQKAVRARLLYWFRANRFGYLQDSVWISPDPLNVGRSVFRKLHATADMAVFMESRLVAASSNDGVVSAAWNFQEVAEAYSLHARFLKSSEPRVAAVSSTEEVWAILAEERRLWRAALDTDPLLPRQLWPRNYPGASALAARESFLRHVRQRRKSWGRRPVDAA
jgi:phenylacetic acid degradation operon negative regulatory protein